MAAVARTGGAIVMGTGIVSIALSLDDRELLSRALLAVAAALLATLGVALAALAASDRTALRESACVPGALTWVAGTDVVGARLNMLGWQHEAEALLVVAGVLWVAVAPRVLAHWRTPTVGLSFLLVVATESLAVLAARLGFGREALVPFALGLVFYVVVLVRFDLRQLLVGRGDHWIAGGALAIAALACARCAQRVSGLHTVTIAMWAAAAAWLPALVVCEAYRRRTTFDELRWSTVFPLGMYAVCSFAAGSVAHVGVLSEFARVWVWVALGAWAVVSTWTVKEIA